MANGYRQFSVHRFSVVFGNGSEQSCQTKFRQHESAGGSFLSAYVGTQHIVCVSVAFFNAIVHHHQWHCRFGILPHLSQYLFDETITETRKPIRNKAIKYQQLTN